MSEEREDQLESEELEDQEGQPLPAREVLSTLTPVDPAVDGADLVLPSEPGIGDPTPST